MPAATPIALEEVLFSPARGRLLSLLLSRRDERFYVREAARMTGVSIGAAPRELATLDACGILLREEVGREVWYRANKACPVHNELRSLMLKTAGAAGVLRAALAPIAGRIASAYLYGSVAKGHSPRIDSDVNVMVLAVELQLADLAGR